MDYDMKSNSWEVKSLLEIKNAFDLLRIFKMFYHFNGRLPLTNGLLVVPDREVPEGSKKISVKYFYEILWPCLSPVFMRLEHIFWRKYFSTKKCPH